jgi:hypothetical protein
MAGVALTRRRRRTNTSDFGLLGLPSERAVAWSWSTSAAQRHRRDVRAWPPRTRRLAATQTGRTVPRAVTATRSIGPTLCCACPKCRRVCLPSMCRRVIVTLCSALIPMHPAPSQCFQRPASSVQRPASSAHVHAVILVMPRYFPSCTVVVIVTRVAAAVDLRLRGGRRVGRGTRGRRLAASRHHGRQLAPTRIDEPVGNLVCESAWQEAKDRDALIWRPVLCIRSCFSSSVG